MARLRKIFARIWRLFTAQGRSLAALLLILVLLSRDPTIFFMTCLLAVLLAVCAAVNRFMPGTVQIRCPERCRLREGHQAGLTYELMNNSRFTVYDLRLRFQDLPAMVRIIDSESVPFLRSGQKTTCRVKICFDRRGCYELTNLRCVSTFPFALFNRPRGRSALTHVMVFPVFGPVHGLDAAAAMGFNHPHLASARLSGEAEEYISSRVSYTVPSARRLDSRAWARLRVPVVREYAHTCRRQTALYLQTRVDNSSAKRDVRDYTFEAAVRTAASCAYTLSTMGFSLDFFCTDHNLYPLDSPAGDDFENVLSILACVESRGDCGASDTAAEVYARLCRQMHSLIFVLWNPNHLPLDLLTGCRRLGCPVRVITVGPGSFDSLAPTVPNEWRYTLEAAEVFQNPGLLSLS